MSGADPDVLVAAIERLQSGQLAECGQLLEPLLEADPSDVGVLHVLGVLRHEQGRPADALQLLERCIALAPDHAAAWNNLGNVRVAAGLLDDAEQAYLRSIEHAGADEDAAATLVNLAAMQRNADRLQDAIRSCRRALELDADLPSGWYGLARALAIDGQVDEALDAHAHAVRLAPDRSTERQQAVQSFLLSGDRGVALRLYRDWLETDPDNPTIRHMLAAAGGAEAPDRADDAYLTGVFDAYAESFDAKLAQLGYRAPQLLADALAARAKPAAGALDVCDAGCGTGLAGPLLRPWARRLAGCDLSVGMLRRARARGAYDVLHRAELVHYLDTQPEAFDLVVAADVLCYFGVLEPALQAAARALRPAGWLGFSVEALHDADPEGHRLMTTGRYAHRLSYLRKTLQSAGFHRVALSRETLRMERGFPVSGWVVTAQRQDPAAPGHFSPPDP